MEYAQFYRLDCILRGVARALFVLGWMPALLSLRLGLTYRYDNRREGIVGRNRACRVGRSWPAVIRALGMQREPGQRQAVNRDIVLHIV